MDILLAHRLNAESPHYDASLYAASAKLAAEYVRNGLSALEAAAVDFDRAYDLADALAPLPEPMNQTTFDKSPARKFSHPAGATQIDVLATAISQILFGGETNRRVEPRNPDDETKAKAFNELLAWNDQQNESYRDGFLWVKDALVTNRAVQHEFICDIFENDKEEVEVELPYIAEVDPRTRKKLPKPKDHKPVTGKRWKTVRKKVGVFVKIMNISPYDFVSDPSVPPGRFQEGRYAGHRVDLTWQELDRRSKLPIDSYEYVLPKTVAKLKNTKARKSLGGVASKGNTTSTSPSYFARQRRGQAGADLGTSEKVNKDDGGVVECWCITVRMKPATIKLYDDEELELIEFLIAGESDLLSVNILPNKHGEYPYAIGEARPSAHQQFAPSVAMILSPTQAMVDYRKNAHEEQIERSGNMLLADPTKCNIEQVMADKTNKRAVVLTTEDAGNGSLDNIIRPIPMPDATATFMAEMDALERTMEKTCGSTSAMQGQKDGPDTTLGEYQDVAQMAMGRVSTTARNLSSGALIRQTRRIGMNLQQWMSDTQTLRITGKGEEFDPETPPAKFLTVRREPLPADQQQAIEAAWQAAVQTAISQGTEPPPRPAELDQPDIQFSFDVIPHDGAMPGVDARAVAAVGRLIEAAANPAFQAAFDNTIPGNYDPRALITYAADKSGVPVQNLRITRETAMKNLEARNLSMGMGMPTAQAQLPAQPQPPGPPPPMDATGQPSAALLPQNPSAEPPQAQGATLAL